jgi:hypothetical protein
MQEPSASPPTTAIDEYEKGLLSLLARSQSAPFE